MVVVFYRHHSNKNCHHICPGQSLQQPPVEPLLERHVLLIPFLWNAGRRIEPPELVGLIEWDEITSCDREGEIIRRRKFLWLSTAEFGEPAYVRSSYNLTSRGLCMADVTSFTSFVRVPDVETGFQNFVPKAIHALTLFHLHG